MKKEFMDFLKKFAVVGTAIGIVTGSAVKSLVDAIVTSVLQPIINRLLQLVGLGTGAGIGINLGGDQVIQIGTLLVSIINFLAIMWVVYLIMKFLLSKLFPEEVAVK